MSLTKCLKDVRNEKVEEQFKTIDSDKWYISKWNLVNYERSGRFNKTFNRLIYQAEGTDMEVECDTISIDFE